MRSILLRLASILAVVMSPQARAQDRGLAEQCKSAASYYQPWLRVEPAIAARTVAGCREAVRREPSNTLLKTHLAVAYLQAKQYAAAFPILDENAKAADLLAVHSLGQVYAQGLGIAADAERAIKFYRYAADRDFAPALYSLGAAYSKGQGVPIDLHEMISLYRRAAARGNAPALTDLGFAYEFGTGVDVNLVEARRLYRLGGEAGSDVGYRNLATLLRYGKGGPIDPAGAILSYRRAAELGNTNAMLNLGGLLVSAEQGYPADIVEAKRWLLAAGATGDPDGYVWLGYHLQMGNGFARNYAEAFAWYKKAADLGSAWGWASLANLYDAGLGTNADRAAATEAYRKAAELGSASAKAELGNRYRTGTDTPRDLPQAAAWYKQAAASGNNLGMHFYANALMNGTGVERDIPAALAILEKAGEQGYAWSYLQLAEYYSRGDPVPSDAQKARAYTLKALANGGPQAELYVAKKYAEGLTLPQRRDKAMALFARALASDADTASEPFAGFLLNGNDPAEQGRVLPLIRSAAERNKGWALAALAHPSERLARLLNTNETAVWRIKILAVKDDNTLKEIAETLKAGQISKQDFDLALRYANSSADRFFAKQFELDLLHELNLGYAAEDSLLDFTRTDAFANAPPERKQALLKAFDQSHTYSVDTETLPKVLQLSHLGLRGATLAGGWFLTQQPAPNRDLARGTAMLRTAVAAGSDEAANFLASVLFTQATTQAQADEAIRFWRESTDRGIPEGARSLAILFGDDVYPVYYGPLKISRWGPKQPDLQQSFQLMLQASNRRDYAAMTMLAVMYLRGNGVRQDTAQAMGLLERAMHCGSNEARVVMARAHLDGAGAVKDAAMALRWFRLAAGYDESLGSFVGSEWMVRAAVNGWGMAPSEAEAQSWLTGAARRGSRSAQLWQRSCGKAARLACLSRQSGMEVPPLAPESAAAPATEVGNTEATLAHGVAVAEDADGSSHAVFEASFKLQQFYLLHADSDKLIPELVRNTLREEARSIQYFGTEPNYFSLIDSSCRWGRASQIARIAKRPEAALFFAKIAVNRLQDARRKIAELDDDIRECFVKAHRDRYRTLADLFMEMGRYGEAEQVLAMLKDFENYSYSRREAKAGSALDRMALDPQQQASYTAFEQAAAALARAGEAQARFSALEASGDLTATQSRDLETARALLRSTNSAFRADVTEVSRQVAWLDADRKTEDSQALAMRIKAVQPRLQNIVRTLGPDTVAIHAVVLPDRVHWLLTTPTYQRAIPIALEEGTLRKLVGAYREALVRRSPDVRERAQELYSAVFAPVDAWLKQVGARRIMLSLDDCLRYVPFAGLHDGKDWLVRRYAFAQFRTAEDMLIGRPERKDWTVAGFGATQGGAGFTPLPGVAFELASIIKGPVPSSDDPGILPGVRRLDQEFTERALTNAMSGNFPVLHIASHFKLDPLYKSNSHLLLGDGTTLSMDEFTSNGSFTFRRVDLLVLSACETALGGMARSGAEVDSMAITAQNLGAASVLASLWSVSDRSTARLMQGFYLEKMAGAGKADALRRAQIALIDSKSSDQSAGPAKGATPPSTGGPAPARNYSHPFYWAPFVLLGDAI